MSNTITPTVFNRTLNSNTITPTVFYRTINVEELEIFYREAGPRDAPTVLLLHGFPSSSHMFRNLIPMLADKYRSEEHTSELQSHSDLVCRLLLESYLAHTSLHSFPTRRSSDLRTLNSNTITPTVFYRTINVEELEIFYREAGPRDAPTVLLLHGFPSSSHMFRNLIPMLADKY